MMTNKQIEPFINSGQISFFYHGKTRTGFLINLAKSSRGNSIVWMISEEGLKCYSIDKILKIVRVNS